jgi:hypothetical protein
MLQPSAFGRSFTVFPYESFTLALEGLNAEGYRVGGLVLMAIKTEVAR